MNVASSLFVTSKLYLIVEPVAGIVGGETSVATIDICVVGDMHASGEDAPVTVVKLPLGQAVHVLAPIVLAIWKKFSGQGKHWMLVLVVV